MLGPVLVWMHHEFVEDGGNALSLGQRMDNPSPCHADAPCSDNCGWASITRLIFRPEEWET